MSGQCGVCAYADEHGSYPSGVHSHCDDCHRNWRGHSECHCVECHRHFGGEVAFDAHRINDVCRDPASIRRNGKPLFRPVERIDGFVWVQVRYVVTIPDAIGRSPREAGA